MWLDFMFYGVLKMDDNTKIIMKIAEDVSAIKATIEHEKDEVSELKIRVSAIEKNMYKILGAILIINAAISLVVPHFLK